MTEAIETWVNCHFEASTPVRGETLVRHVVGRLTHQQMLGLVRSGGVATGNTFLLLDSACTERGLDWLGRLVRLCALHGDVCENACTRHEDKRGTVLRMYCKYLYNLYKRKVGRTAPIHLALLC